MSAHPELEIIDDLSEQQLDELPYGVIQLSPEGFVLGYNVYESRMSGRKKIDVIGKNFFREVAPCLEVQAFETEFRQGVRDKALDAQFSFVMPFARPRYVTLTLLYSAEREIVWVLISDATLTL